MRQKTHCSRQTMAPRPPGPIAISRRMASAACLQASFMERWRTACRRPLVSRKLQPGRQVIALAGDGGISMLFGDLMTIVHRALPIKIAVYDNGKLGFVEIEQKAEGMLDTFTKIEKPELCRGCARVRSLGPNGFRGRPT